MQSYTDTATMKITNPNVAETVLLGLFKSTSWYESLKSHGLDSLVAIGSVSELANRILSPTTVERKNSDSKVIDVMISIVNVRKGTSVLISQQSLMAWTNDTIEVPHYDTQMFVAAVYNTKLNAIIYVPRTSYVNECWINSETTYAIHNAITQRLMYDCTNTGENSIDILEPDTYSRRTLRRSKDTHTMLFLNLKRLVIETVAISASRTGRSAGSGSSRGCAT